jgi:hypothetical protein
MLVRGDASEDVYLLDRGRKRRIRDCAILDKYWFDPDRIALVRQALVNHFSWGPPWE